MHIQGRKDRLRRERTTTRKSGAKFKFSAHMTRYPSATESVRPGVFAGGPRKPSQLSQLKTAREKSINGKRSRQKNKLGKSAAQFSVEWVCRALMGRRLSADRPAFRGLVFHGAKTSYISRSCRLKLEHYASTNIHKIDHKPPRAWQ